MSSMYKRLNTRIDLQEKVKIETAEETEKEKEKGKRTLQPIISPYALEDPMYQYIQEKRRKEKEARIRQLKSLLESSTDSSSDSSESNSEQRKRKKKKHTEDSRHGKKPARSPDEHSIQKHKNKSKKLKKKKKKQKKSSKKVEWVDASTLPNKMTAKQEATGPDSVLVKTEKVDDGYTQAVIKSEAMDNGAEGPNTDANLPNIKEEPQPLEHSSTTNNCAHLGQSNVKDEPEWLQAYPEAEGAPGTVVASSRETNISDKQDTSEASTPRNTNDEERIRRLMLHMASQSKLASS